jgi:MFS family permease
MTAQAIDAPAAVSDAAHRRDLTNAAILIIVGVLATTLSQPQVLARIPLTNMLKNELHVSRSSTSAFFFLMGLPWYCKPIAGIVTDAFPIFGSRRRSYLIASTLLATLSWVGLYFTPHQYNALLLMCLLLSTFMVVASTVVGGYMVEIAQASSASGRLSSIRNATSAALGIFSAPASGYLASIAFGWTAGACGAVMFLLLPATFLLLREERRRIDSAQVLANFGQQLNNIASARTLWAAAGLTLLVFIAPGFGTALFYKQQNELHMTTVAQGFLGSIAGTCALAAPFVYIWACRRWNLRFMLWTCLAAGAATTLGFMFYSSVFNARIIEGVNAFTGTLGEVALMDLAVRATPKGSEGLGFSLMVSVRNLALFGTDLMGSLMLDKLHLPFNDLVLANAGTTAIAAALVFVLPAALVSRKDSEADIEQVETLGGYPEPKTQPQP